MAQALLNYPQDSAWITRQGGEARRLVQARFSIPAMAGAYTGVYQQALG